MLALHSQVIGALCCGMPLDVLIKTILRNLLLPPNGLIVLVIVGIVLLLRYRKTGWLCIWCGLLAWWLTSTPFIADRLTHIVERYPPLNLRHDSGAQAVVILGGGFRRNAPEYSRHAPSDSTLQRLTYGARVAHITHLPILVSGGTPEAETMQWFLENVFDLSVAWRENASRDTRDNARFSAPILRAQHIEKIILVTSSSHMARAVAEFKSNGLEVVPAPADMWTHDDLGILSFIPSIAASRRSHQVFYELLGDGVRRLRN